MWTSAKAVTPAGPGATKNLGMTAPISQAGPEPRDLELTAELQESLIPHGCFESEEELNHRMNVLRYKDTIWYTVRHNLDLGEITYPGLIHNFYMFECFQSAK